ncbi:MAG: hypothetical protein HFH49_15515 [Lachnospiraceae bacterium]|nr:hypothetical protein [Lachnospiraceae bacterium]
MKTVAILAHHRMSQITPRHKIMPQHLLGARRDSPPKYQIISLMILRQNWSAGRRAVKFLWPIFL